MKTFYLHSDQNNRRANEELRHICRERLRPEISPEDARQLESELELVQANGLAPHYLDLHHMADRARETGHLLYVRHLPGGSLVMHCLGLYPLNPVRHGLVSDLFLKPLANKPFEITLQSSYGAAEAVSGTVLAEDSYHILPSLQCDKPRVEFTELPLLDEIAICIRQGWQGPRDAALTDAEIEATVCSDTDSLFYESWERRIVEKPNDSRFANLVIVEGMKRPEVWGREEWEQEEISEGIEDPEPTAHLPIIYQDATKDTFGMLLFREQIMKILAELGGMSYEAGYHYMKAVWMRRNKWKPGEAARFGFHGCPENEDVLETFKSSFIAAATKVVELKAANEIYDRVHRATRNGVSMKSQLVLNAYVRYQHACAINACQQLYISTKRGVNPMEMHKRNRLIEKCKEDALASQILGPHWVAEYIRYRLRGHNHGRVLAKLQEMKERE